ncbi:MAG: excinuclease ABC subunit UvrA, partial [Clostridia bacterium]|nr:excinuclease ABC subunit UvrA [Clostridia bacterium]
MNENIIIKGAKENNLKNVSLEIPRNKLVVFTGISGSGKSTLAFDTIFAEGQRRYVESLSSYARQFLGEMKKPDVELIEGLSPAISIDQKTTSRNPRSTVGTVTEIYDYLRLLYARIGTPYCPNCGKEINRQTVDEICDKIMNFPQSSKIMVLSPIARGKKGEFKKELESLRKSGYARVKIDGITYLLDEPITLEKNIRHDIYVIVDRIIIKEGIERRLTDSLENALGLSDGIVVIDKDGEEILYSTKYSCPDCGTSIEEIEPRLFSFNSPFGACPHCLGLGYVSDFSEDLIIPDKSLSLAQKCIKVGGWSIDTSKFGEMYLSALAKRYGFSLYTPFKDLPKEIQHIIFYGNEGELMELQYEAYKFKGSYTTSYEGIIPSLKRKLQSASEFGKSELEKYMITSNCPVCNGLRLKKEALAVKVGGLNIAELTDLSVDRLLTFLDKLELTQTQLLIGANILKEIKVRLNFLKNVGLSYLTLSRSAGSLSGGEAQRIRLATQIGSGLTGVLYILDEPSIGLHQRDNKKLIEALKNLKNLGNTLIVVEHDEDTIKSADYIVDIGEGAGELGG